jgi:hypothetical protein
MWTQNTFNYLPRLFILFILFICGHLSFSPFDTFYITCVEGYGMYWIQDDVAKLMQFVHINKGRVGSTQIVDPESLAEAMQQRPDARGLVPNNPNESLQYNYAFWADKYLASSNDNPFTCDLYVPYMSGYGGIRFVMMPNDVVYYYFSDDGQYTQRREVEECDKIRPLCT